MLNKLGSRLYDLIKNDFTMTYREIEETKTWSREYKNHLHEMKRKSLWK